MFDNLDTETWNMIFFSGALLILVFVIRTAFQINDFTKELRYLNCEIRRTDGNEQKHWIRKRRKLWLSLIPFVRY